MATIPSSVNHIRDSSSRKALVFSTLSIYLENCDITGENFISLINWPDLLTISPTRQVGDSLVVDDGLNDLFSDH